MMRWMAEQGHQCEVVTTPPYYPQWKIGEGYFGGRYCSEWLEASGEKVGAGDGGAVDEGGPSPRSARPSQGEGEVEIGGAARPSRRDEEVDGGPSPRFARPSQREGEVEIGGSARPSQRDEEVDGRPSPRSARPSQREGEVGIGAEPIRVIRCPLWVPGKVSGLKRIIHLASFGLSSVPVMLWKAVTFRPDVILTVEPAAMCMPTTWLAARLCGAKAWLHVQDFEVDAAFELGILKQPLLKRMVLAAEAFLMRRFDRVSSISPNMQAKLAEKGVHPNRIAGLPNWVDCDMIRPLDAVGGNGTKPGEPPASDPAAESDTVSRRIDGPHFTADGSAEPKVTVDAAAADGIDRRSLRQRFGIPADRFVALYAGNIGAKQGLEIIVDAAKALAERPGDGDAGRGEAGQVPVHLVICGTGAAVDDLRARAQGVPGLQLLPPQPWQHFNELMNCADLHLLPQKAGAADLVMPSKLTGMLASGRPVVACADPGTQIADVVQGRGVVVPAGDTAGFTAAIRMLADDPVLCGELGRAARRFAVDHLGRDAILRRFESALFDLLGPSELPQRADSVPAPLGSTTGAHAGEIAQAAELRRSATPQ
ncbi:WcaI family glycosyltransferase [Crateriforma spongiae]|uniref:WcaI family glycosyltransferase n=1 Tax=Crateriforma spongiae TaxID=2724528 RepID=UPI0028F4071A|nr:WcaI family glycosyltransferase [Crateriforma spongiae]